MPGIDTRAVWAQSGNVANAAAVATLPATANQTNYIYGFQITAAGATAAQVVSVTVAGLLGGTMTFNFTVIAGVALANNLAIRFETPMPASGANVAIVVTVPALGAGNTNCAVVAYGLQT